MEYPGNNSLSSDVRERVLNTYRQTLGLATQGNRQEASLGCDFILRLDPEFEPARTLMSRLERGDGAVQVDDLQPGGPAFNPASSEDPFRSEDPFSELEDVDLDLSEGEGAAVRATAPPAAGVGGLQAELQGLLQERRFSELLQRAEQEGADDPGVRQIVRTARSRLEAEPYLRSFIESAQSELRAGNREQGARLLESARELDASHPEVRELSQLLGAASSGSSGSSGSPAATPPASAPVAEEIDLGAGGISLEAPSASGAGGSGDDGRIRDLLKEGQAAYDQADYQGAIDAWSRIFLIDIDHQEAARRIEQARRLKAEHERQVEEVFHEGLSAFEAGNADEAAEKLRTVLELQPNHLAAKEYLQKIEAGETPQPGAAASAAPAAPRARTTAVPDLPPTEGDTYSEDVLIPPEPAQPQTTTETDSAGGARPNRVLALLGALVLIGVLAGGWFVYQQWDSWFPNANDPAAGPTRDPIRSATGFHALGKTELAIAQLKRLTPDDPHYKDAQVLISKWEAEVAERVAAQPEPTGGSSGEGGPPELADPEQKSLQDDLVARARRAVEAGRYLEGENLLLEARQIAQLDATGQSLLARTAEGLEPMRSQIELIRGGDWEFAQLDLWRMREENPSDPNIEELLVISYYNLGVRDLQRGDATNALAQFEEASALLGGAPDPELERHTTFARAYQGRNKDLLYQIYVKYLPIRR